MTQITAMNSITGRMAAALLLALALVLGAGGAAHAIDTEAKQAILVEYDTHAVLFEKNADELMHPSSMSKMMTVDILFEHLKNGSVKLDDELPVSEKAWRMQGSKMFVAVGSKVKVEDLIRGIVVQSGNDACIAVAEGLDGSEEAYVEEMNRRAKEIGLTNSTFKNVTGWPDPEHLTTARDLALLARRTIADFPEYYRYYSELNFTYNGIKQGNRNPLLYKDLGADGLKTGHTEQGGYGITGSAKRGERRLILVLNGLSSMKSRAEESEKMMDWGFREFDNYALFKAGDTVSDAEVWLGDAATVPLAIESDVKVTLPRKSRRAMKVTVNYDGPIAAPIVKGTKIAKLVIAAPDVDPIEIPLVAGADVGKLGFSGRVVAALRHVVWGSIQ
ncbi:MAG TPA: D-alanyl-D-alanine carboxypeptidase family protein [Alphaproteobacteria bacterium]|jgi:D-alanyl-D-alanine carboxypeptidase (penicillin-binding protein 5/6)|nr:D-alanyl-D-alanine carboxypeptidase family protein [Alphaproteobacteria bacterium]